MRDYSKAYSASERAEWSFAELLDWHLGRGTRPNRNPDIPDIEWDNKEFGEKIGVDERSVRNWRRGSNRPADIGPLAAALFGYSQAHANMRSEFIRRYQEARRNKHFRERIIPARKLIGVPPRIANFTGRTDMLERVKGVLAGGKAKREAAIGRIVLQGLPGVGKTSLAVEYVHLNAMRHTGVWWLIAETRVSTITHLANCAKELGICEPAAADLNSSAKAALNWVTDQRAKYLLVYDSASHPNDILDLLPALGARVLITSRFPDWKGWAEELEISVLPIKDAIAFLRDRAGLNEENGIQFLAKTVGCLPLALDHAAATCRQEKISFSEYTAKLENLLAQVPRGVSYPRSVSATFELAIASASSKCRSAERLITFLAYCAPERIPTMLVAGAIESVGEGSKALKALISASLVKYDLFEDNTRAVTVHPIVQMVARARSTKISRAILERLVVHLYQIYPRDGISNPEAWPICARLTPHVLILRNFAIRRTREFRSWRKLLGHVAAYFHGRASLSEADELLTELLAITEKAAGTNARETANVANQLALLRADRDDPTALSLFERALKIREKVLGPNHAETAETLNDLATLYAQQGLRSKAKALLKRALRICEKKIGPRHPHTAVSLVNLASVVCDEGDFELAKDLFQRTLAICKKVFPSHHPYIAKALANLADLSARQGDLSEARDRFTESLEILERSVGGNHPDTAHVLVGLAEVFRAQGDLANAQPLLERAFKIYEEGLGHRHRTTLDSLFRLADVLLHRRDLAGSRKRFDELFERQSVALGPEHYLIAITLGRVARILHEQNEGASAREVIDQALAILNKSLRHHVPDAAFALCDLAILISETDVAKALRHLRRALTILETVVEPDDPEANRLRGVTARLLLKIASPSEALPFARAALSGHEKSLGRTHPWTIESARITVDALIALGRPHDAAKLRRAYGLLR